MKTKRTRWIVHIDPDPDDYDAKLEVRVLHFGEPKMAKEVETLINRALHAPALVWGVVPYEFH